MHFCFLGFEVGRGLRTALSCYVSGLHQSSLDSVYAPDGLVEDTLEVALCEGRALHVLDCLDLLGNADGLLILNGCHLLLSQALLGALVVAKIELGSDQDDGNSRCVVLNLGVPLFT